MLGRLLISLPALLAVAVAGCGDDGEPSAAEPEPITFQRTGGITGERVLLEISPSGEAVLTSGPSSEEVKVRFQLSERQQNRLQELLADAELNQLEPPEELDLQCADCYDYRLRIGPETFEASAANLPEPLRPIVGQIEAIIAQCCPGQGRRANDAAAPGGDGEEGSSGEG